MLGLGGIIGGAAGALGGIFGGIGRNRAINRAIKSAEDQKARNLEWYDQRYNEDATQRADAQRMLQMTAEAIKNRNRAAAGQAAVTGGTEESVAATKAANAEAMANAASAVTAAGEARKDQIENQYRQRDAQLQQQIDSLQAQKQGVMDIANAGLAGAAQGVGAGLGIDQAIKDLKG